MNCGHASYQCGAAFPGQDSSGAGQILVVMWCTECGAVTLRIPQIDPADEKIAALGRGIRGKLPVGKG